MGRIAQRIKTGEHVCGNGTVAVPHVCHRDAKVLCKGPGPVDPDAARAPAKMSSSSQAVAAVATDDVSFPGDQVADLEVVNVAPDLNDRAHKLVTHRHGNRNGPLSPLVPVIDVNVRSTDSRLVDLDEHIIDSDVRNGNLFQPQTGLRFRLDQRFHGLHGLTPNVFFMVMI
jgi:hypothetical protein